MKQIKFRTLTIEDYNPMIKLWKRASLPFKPQGRDGKRMIDMQIKTFPEFFIGAFHQDKLVGVVIASYDGRLKGWINRLAVDPSYRRRGIAEHLIGRAEKALKGRGAAIFCALVETPNEESIKLFRKMGYLTHEDVLYVTKRESQEL